MQQLTLETSRSPRNKHAPHCQGGGRRSCHNHYNKCRQELPQWANPRPGVPQRYHPLEDESRQLARNVGHPSPPDTPSRTPADSEYPHEKRQRDRKVHGENSRYDNGLFRTPPSERSSADWRHTVLGPTQHAPNSHNHRPRSPPASPILVSPSTLVDSRVSNFEPDQPRSESYLPRIRNPYDSASRSHPQTLDRHEHLHGGCSSYPVERSGLQCHHRSSMTPTSSHPHYLRHPGSDQTPCQPMPGPPPELVSRRSNASADYPRVPLSGASAHYPHDATQYPQHYAGPSVYASPGDQVVPQYPSDHGFPNPHDPRIPPATVQEMLELQRSYYHYYQAPLQTSRKRGNLPKDATEMLKKWLEENKDTPYPTEDQKKIFERETGLTLQQISNWFINARRRHLGRSGILGKNNGNSAGNPATASGNY